LSKQPQSALVFTDLGIADELEEKAFRDQFFRTEREIDIPAQLKALRKLRNLTQEELAARVGTKQSGISRIERSQEAKWELDTLVKWAEALDARLSVVIEPYENVVARYRSETRDEEHSAAKAETTDSARQPEPHIPRVSEPPRQQEPGSNSILGHGGGAKWN
jgi:transcriptional regulator with XRE-family HTH domain